MLLSAKSTLWFVVGAGIGVTGILGITAVAAGQYGAGLWHAVAGLVIVFFAAAAALAGLELLARHQLVPLAWWVLLAAPAEAATLLAGNWKEHVSQSYGSGLITAAVLLLTGGGVATLRLVVRNRAGLVAFAATGLTAGAVAALGLVLAWTRSTPTPALRALLSLTALTILLYALTLLVQRFSGPPRPG